MLGPIERRESEMPKVSRESAAHVLQQGPVEDRHEDLDGYTVNFTRFEADIDGAPLLKGLPDDRCQCPHWGYVLSGRMTFHYGDREEILEAGDAFYTPPGHVPAVAAGTEIVQFSPADELKVTEEVMMANMQALSAGS